MNAAFADEMASVEAEAEEDDDLEADDGSRTPRSSGSSTR